MTGRDDKKKNVCRNKKNALKEKEKLNMMKEKQIHEYMEESNIDIGK